ATRSRVRAVRAVVAVRAVHGVARAAAAAAAIRRERTGDGDRRRLQTDVAARAAPTATADLSPAVAAVAATRADRAAHRDRLACADLDRTPARAARRAAASAGGPDATRAATPYD